MDGRATRRCPPAPSGRRFSSAEVGIDSLGTGVLYGADLVHLAGTNQDRNIARPNGHTPGRHVSVVIDVHMSSGQAPGGELDHSTMRRGGRLCVITRIGSPGICLSILRLATCSCPGCISMRGYSPRLLRQCFDSRPVPRLPWRCSSQHRDRRRSQSISTAPRVAQIVSRVQYLRLNAPVKSAPRHCCFSIPPTMARGVCVVRPDVIGMGFLMQEA